MSRGQLAKTALACVSSCMATDQWGGLLGVLQGAQAALEGQEEPELRALAAEMHKVCLPWPSTTCLTYASCACFMLHMLCTCFMLDMHHASLHASSSLWVVKLQAGTCNCTDLYQECPTDWLYNAIAQHSMIPHCCLRCHHLAVFFCLPQEALKLCE